MTSTSRPHDAQALRAAMLSGQAPDGLRAGTTVLTQDGALPVEYLTEGDRVISRDRGLVTVRAISRRMTVCPAVQVRADAPGGLGAQDDVILPAGQRILLRDWRARAMYGTQQKVVPISALIDGETVRDLGLKRLRLFTLDFDHEHVVYAGGLELVQGTARHHLRLAA